MTAFNILFQQCNQVKWFKLQEATNVIELAQQGKRKVVRDELPSGFLASHGFLAPRAPPPAHLRAPENHKEDKAFSAVLA